MTFIQNIVNWFVLNKDALIAFFTSTNFVGFVTAIVLFVKQIKASKDNTAATKTLNQSIDVNNELTGAVADTQNRSKEILLENKELKEKLEFQRKEFDDFKDAIFAKINAIMDVQSIVYSTIRDDTARSNVMNLLTSAKFAEVKTRADLEAELESLRDALTNKVEDVKKLADEAVNNVKKTISPDAAEVNESNVMRY